MKSEKPITTKEQRINQMTDVTRHPAFGMFRIGRVSGGQNLFGSEVLNAGYIEVEVSGGEEYWRHSQKHYSSARKPIIRLAMSYSQFAEAITCQNVGEGVPCTLEYVNGERIPAISQNTISTSDQVKLDIKSQSGKINKAADKLRAKIDDLKLSKIQKGELSSALDEITRELNSNLPFIIDQCEEAVEHITTKGKIEVEAFAQGRIRELGMQALAEKQNNLLIEGKND